MRYLPPGEKIGERKQAYLTVVTFPFTGAYQALQGLAKKGHRIVDQVGKGLLIGVKGDPHVYLAYPNVDFEVEVYDPDPARAVRRNVGSRAADRLSAQWRLVRRQGSPAGAAFG